MAYVVLLSVGVLSKCPRSYPLLFARRTFV